MFPYNYFPVRSALGSNERFAMIIFILIGSIYFILLDELIMGCSQRRIGPLNLGSYGILPSIINGCNLIIPQLRVPKIHFHLVGLENGDVVKVPAQAIR